MNLLDVLQVVLIILKVTHTVNWSWWVVLIPFWYTLVYCLLGGGKHE